MDHAAIVFENYCNPAQVPAVKPLVNNLQVPGLEGLGEASLKSLMRVHVEAASLDYCRYTDNIRNIAFWRKYGMESGGVIHNVPHMTGFG